MKTGNINIKIMDNKYIKQILITVLLAVYILNAGGTEITLIASEDAPILKSADASKAYWAEQNRASSPYLYSCAWTSGGPFYWRSLLKFDFSAIPENAEITSAKISLYAYGSKHNPLTKSNASYLQRVTGSWSESTVCWNNQPTSTSANQVTLPRSNAANEDYTDVDVTALIKDIISAGTNNGLLLKLVNEQYYTILTFWSREASDPSKHPKLVIEYEVSELDDEIPEPGSIPWTPISNWKFDGNGNDASEYGNHTTLNSTVHTLTTDRYGNANKAVILNSNLTVPASTSYEVGKNDYSIAFWMKANTDQSYVQLFSLKGGPWDYDGFDVGIDFSDGYFNSYLTIDNDDLGAMSAGPYVNVKVDSEWHQYIVTFDRDGNGILYFDGKIINSTDISILKGINILAGTPLKIGGGGNAFDDVRLYNMALTQNDVKDMYKSEYPYLSYQLTKLESFTTGSPTYTKNFVRSVTPREAYSENIIENFLTSTEAITQNGESLNEEITYADGLGRPEQIVLVEASPSGNDIIKPIEYDEFGRESIKYLPYTRSGSVTFPSGSFNYNAYEGRDYKYSSSKQYMFYQDPKFDHYGPDRTKAFSKTIFEASPLGRVLEQGAPGEDWQPSNETGNSDGHTVKVVNKTNTSTVPFWNVATTYVPGGVTSINNTIGIDEYKLDFTGFSYAANTLYVTETRDENWVEETYGHLTREYKDKQGQVVIKESEVLIDGVKSLAKTRYIYDDFGLLRCVIPPLASGPANIDLCYYYVYDEKKRMIIKKLPGAEPVLMVYDKRDRLILTQDGNQRNKDNPELSFTKYDVLNRPIITGVVTNTENYSIPTQHKAIVDFIDNYWGEEGDYIYERFSTSNGNAHNYTEWCFPVWNNSYYGSIEYEIYTVNYYDNYNFRNDNNDFPDIYEFNSGGSPDVGDMSANYNVFGSNFESYSNVTGMPTGTKTRILGTYNWLNSVVYYDNKLRAIRSVSSNHLGGVDRISTKFNFAGEVVATIAEHNLNDANEVIVAERFEYDHTGRLLENWQQIKGQSEILLTANVYNELGEVVEKYLHGEPGSDLTNAIQKIDYRYNIRGWLTSINNPDNFDTGEHDLFAMNLFYNNVDDLGHLSSDAQYNGNIAATIWNNAHNNIQKGYGYKYDALNRLLEADYGEGTAFTIKPDFYSVKDISYDLNGNIKTLNRFGGNPFNGIDDLVYNYKGNQLIGVKDDAGNEQGFKDGLLNDGSTEHYPPSWEYQYDANGNMYIDKNKGITDIEYNLLNLPQTITKGGQTISYGYSAGGSKLWLDRPNENNTSIATTDYIGNFIYEDGSLAYMLTAEGKYDFIAERYEYHLKDHLGNTRVAFNDNGDITQATDYYPFGMVANKYDNAGGIENKYLYNGKELQEGTDWYDYGARMYDPAMGRWHAIDPMAEKYNNWSPYSYCFNNPVRFIDPDGMNPDEDEVLKNEVSDVTYNKEDKTYTYTETTTSKSKKKLPNKYNEETQTMTTVTESSIITTTSTSTIDSKGNIVKTSSKTKTSTDITTMETKTLPNSDGKPDIVNISEASRFTETQGNEVGPFAKTFSEAFKKTGYLPVDDDSWVFASGINNSSNYDPLGRTPPGTNTAIIAMGMLSKNKFNRTSGRSFKDRKWKEVYNERINAPKKVVTPNKWFGVTVGNNVKYVPR